MIISFFKFLFVNYEERTYLDENTKNIEKKSKVIFDKILTNQILHFLHFSMLSLLIYKILFQAAGAAELQLVLVACGSL